MLIFLYIKLFMVKITEPEKNDLTEIFFNFIFNKNECSFDNLKIRKMLKSYLKGDFKNEMKKNSKLKQINVPDFILTGNCAETNFFSYSKKSYFPVEYNLEKDKIEICSNFIKNRKNLKENLDREIFFSNLLKERQDMDIFDNLTKSYLNSCAYSMKNYFNNKKLLNRSSIICARYILKYRNFNYEEIPFDNWVRFINKKVNQFSV